MKTYKVQVFADLAGIPIKTLQNWHKSGKLVAGTNFYGRRYYTDEHMAEVKNIRHEAEVIAEWKRISKMRVTDYYDEA